jgi:tungstate transport system ATP-binding protein
MIRFYDVTLRAGALTILDRITLDIAPGAPTVLLGPNGAGKTSLIRLAMRLVAPSAGRVECPEPSAMVFQRPAMLRRSVRANVAYVSRDDAVAMLARVGLASLAQRPARRLSGGEQQRLALARALARKPVVLFLDEPTASLDPAATGMVEDIVGEVAAAGIKVVMATHDLGQARRLAGDVVFLANGRIVEHAAGDRFFSTPRSREAVQFIKGELVL